MEDKRIKAVIMAGGKGTRLHPYTFVLPKPLMPVGGQPVIEIILKWLRRSGIEQISITTGYLGHLIRALCGDGEQWGLQLHYVLEPEPLGTMGSLRLIKDQLDTTFIVVNGDLITNLDLVNMIGFHQQHGGPITLAITKKSYQHDLGLVSIKDHTVTDFREKPRIFFDVCMGVYCLEPEVLDLIPDNVPFGIDSLMHEAFLRDIPVHTYFHDGIWMDIGREEDFLKAQKSFNSEYKEMILGA